METDTEFWEDRNPYLLLILYRINGVVSTISCFIGIYLVLFKSPSRFGFYRYFLLNIVFVVPLTTLILPFMMLSVLSALSTFSVGRYTSYIVLLGTTHSLANTLMMALTIRPFTRYFLQKFGKKMHSTEMYSVSKTNNENSKPFTSKAAT
uniref:Serpentine receptor class gamma n=1 Tax=Bursaphelenchus xylophilus TaxID=6326 RepID=A0A1I7RM17_BURXY